jgi:hypothetical protein
MASTKRLQKAAAKFRKREPERHALLSRALSVMAYFIKKSGEPEMTINLTTFECNANDKY